MSRKEEFIDKYGRKRKPRERFQRAIRAEVAGGDLLLDLLELVHGERRQIVRGFGDDPVLFLERVEDRLQDLRDVFVEEVKKNYE